MILREYRKEDAIEILKWIKNEREFRLWSSDRYKSYPIIADDINKNYSECQKKFKFYPLTLEDNGKIIGHLILRELPHHSDIIRLGFVIVDSSIRGKGYGKKLIEEAIKYSREVLNINKFSLGVFANNDNAFNCYKSVGFKVVDIEKETYKFYDETWDCVEMILVRE